MVTKSELKYIEDELNSYLKLKYPNATFIRTCGAVKDNDVNVIWLGDSGINNIDQAIGYLQCIIDRKFPKKHTGKILRMIIWDDIKLMEKFPETKAVYGWAGFLGKPCKNIQNEADKLRAKSNG